MMFRTGLSAACLEDDLEDSATLDSAHRRLIRILLRHGVIVHSSAEEQEAFLRQVEAAGPIVRPLWKTALEKLRRRVAEPAISAPIQAIEDSATLRHHWADHIEVAIVEPVRAAFLGVPEGKAAVIDASGLEVARYDLIDQAETVADIVTLCEREVPTGSSRDKLWAERIQPLAREANFITLLDRHAVEQLVRQESPGLAWLLSRIDGCGKSSVHLISGIDNSSEQALIEAVTDLRQRLRAGGIQDLTLTLAHDYHFAEHSHARHVRFDRQIALLLESGVACFSKVKVKASFPCMVLNVLDAETRERAIGSVASVKRVRIGQ